MNPTIDSCFRNKIVWITGASSGIGEALARRLSFAGAGLILSSNEPEELARVDGALDLPEDRVMTLPLDLSELSALPAAAARVLERFGRVDYLFNNGGISQRALARDVDIGVDQRIMAIDYFGHVALTKAVLPSMLERKSGHIVVTSSVMGLMGAPLRSAYCAAKHALHGFFDALRAEVWRDNIRVTIVCPAAVQTGISVHAVTGNNQTWGRMDRVVAAGITPDRCALRILGAVASGKEMVLVGGGRGRIGANLKRFFPGLYSRIIRRAAVT